MNAPNAICMSVDYRVTNRNDGAVLDPFVIKSLIIQTSMEPGGPKAILAYTGLAELWGRMPMGRWLRETLRGECQSIGDLVGHLLNQLNKKIASFNQVLIINILAVNGPNGEERYCGGISNTQDFQTAMPQFVGGFGPIDTPRAFANGSAAFTVQAGGYPDLLKGPHGYSRSQRRRPHEPACQDQSRGGRGRSGRAGQPVLLRDLRWQRYQLGAEDADLPRARRDAAALPYADDRLRNRRFESY